jgi:hypothetical protein
VIVVDRIEIELARPVAEELDAGAELTLTVGLKSSGFGNFAETPFEIRDADAVRHAGLLELAGEARDRATIALKAPDAVGAFAWALVIPEHARDGKNCGETSLSFSFRTRPHVTSLAAWDCPSPVVIGETFRVKVAAQCSAGCATLPGERIVIRDAGGAEVASATLGETPWPGTDALYWSEVEVPAPSETGVHAWKVEFAADRLRLPHGAASFAFSAMVDRPAEHTVIVKVCAQESHAPIDDAQVRLGSHRAATDASGIARLAVPGGTHELFVWKAGFEAPTRRVEVTSDASIEVAANALPEVNPDSYWQG